MRTAFVTGGSGHVGGNLVRLLLNKGWTVRCLIHNDMRALGGLNIEKVKGDLLDADFLCDKLSGCDAVFHAAAQIAIENVDIELMHKKFLKFQKTLEVAENKIGGAYTDIQDARRALAEGPGNLVKKTRDLIQKGERKGLIGSGQEPENEAH